MANTRSFRNTRRAPIPQRRKKIWARRGIEGVGVDDTGTAVRPLSDYRAAGGDTLGATVGGVRLAIEAEVVVAGAGESVNLVVAGIVNSESDAEMNIPFNRPHDDWFIWCPVILQAEAGSRAGTLPGQECVFRSMRKLEELGEDFVLSLQVQDLMATVNVNLVVSTLLILP